MSLLVILSFPGTPEPAVARLTPSRSVEIVPVRFGPGVFTSSSFNTGPASASPKITHSDGLVTTSDQRLVVNIALRKVFDDFLRDGMRDESPANVDRLYAYLKAALPAPAYSEAVKILDSYLTYTSAYNRLLSQRSATSGSPEELPVSAYIDEFDAWVSQLAALRESMLGADVAGTWFGEEQTRHRQAVAALRAGGAMPQPAEDVGKDPLHQVAENLHVLQQAGVMQRAR
ncbi:MAG: hypothetical protein A3I66_18135 [Burkholderiales bacterium RIFCSPLOWO2_02_FULL_57_36]|nr:MAG: hypothetical protein A3I66_18135 [Burkholderiales bacterium RIFCSPLOWO2_02_FULL_57_36]